MRRTCILISVTTLCALGLIAQDDELTQYQTMMKAAIAANGAAGKALADKNVAGVAAEASKEAAAFDQIAAFWKKKGKDDAVKFSETARDSAKAAASATSPDDQAAAMAKARGTCGGCHAIYRDGSKFKS